MITGIHHAQITIPEGVDEAAREFYCGVLGLPEIQKPEALASRASFWVQAGDRQVHIASEPGVDRTATKAHLAYEVSSLEEWRPILAQHGISVLESIPIPGFDRFEFRDPFGNRVELIQIQKPL